MKNFVQRSICLLVSIMLMLGNAPAFANGVTAAFNSLVSSGANPAVAVNQAGYYSSETTNTFTAGGLDVRFPQRTLPSIINVTPMQWSAGCGGISFAFGGFSFINGTEIEGLIKSVAQDAIGMAVELVMTTLCGPCASVMQVMRQLALEASNHSIDACHLASQFMAKYGKAGIEASGIPSIFNSAASSMCGLFSSINGFVSDDTKATSGSTCSSISESISSVGKYANEVFGNAPGGASPQVLCALDGPCNELWQVLNKTALNKLPDTPGSSFPTSDRYKLLLMNLLGTNIIIDTSAASASSGSSTTSSTSTGSSSSSTTSAAAPKSASNGSTISATQALGQPASARPGPNDYLPTLGNIYGKTGQQDLNAVYKLLMCGTEVPPNMSATAQGIYDWQCSDTPTLKSTPGQKQQNALAQLDLTPVWVCLSSLKESVATPDLNAYANCDYVGATTLGLSPLAGEGFLPQVAQLLASGVTAIQQGKSLSPQLIGLIQSVPVPLYQAINIAAVYPQAGANLISLMSVEVSELLTYSYIQQIVRYAGLFQQQLHIPQSQIAQIFGLLDAIRAGTINDEHTMLTQMTLQNQMMQEIRILNVAMQRQVLPPQLLTENAFSSQLSSAAANAGAPAGGGQ